MKKKLLFGPVLSRRLGRSLGLELVPKKICTLNCIYCEVGKTTYLTKERKAYYPWELIEKSIFIAKEMQDKFDVLTITGSGEPVLNIYFEKTVELAKKEITKPVAILTNSTLINIESIRKALSKLDIVLASLDSAREESFKKVNQPAPGIEVKEIIEGLKILREEMEGELWLEVLLVEGVNDTQEDLEALKQAIEYINPHKIQLNTVIRPPAYKFAKPLDFERLQKIAEFLGKKAEVIVSKRKLDSRKLSKKLILNSEEIVEYLKRRPAPIDEIAKAFEIEEKILLNYLKELISKKIIEQKEHYGKVYFFIKGNAEGKEIL